MKELQHNKDFNLSDKRALEVYSNSDYRLCVSGGKMGVYANGSKSDFVCNIDSISDFERFLIDIWEELQNENDN